MAAFLKLPILTIVRQAFSRRGLLIIAGIVICIYSLAVLLYVQSIPDIGLKSVFSVEIKGTPRPGADGFQPLEGDIVKEVGNIKIKAWPTLLSAPIQLRRAVFASSTLPSGTRLVKNEEGEKVLQARVIFARNGEEFETWRVLGNLPLEEFLPSIVWFFSHLLLFLVGAMVLWKRPTDTAAALFFLLCIVTVGGYMGGYHWLYIATQPVLILLFMICAVMVPVVSLHFYLIFPRKKAWLEKHPRAGMLAIYGPPLVFLAALMALYIRLRVLVQGRAPAEDVESLLYLLRITASCYLLVASLWYLASVASLVHSFVTVTEPTERKQVQWIMFGALLALLPFSYSLYLALFDPDAFGAGAATWPMFAASVCLTVAFAISITRYRLMELDQLISSGVVYFLISFSAGLVYYAVFFIGTLVFQAQPRLSEALTVSTTALVLMLALDLARSRLKKVLDRRYFREKSQLDKTLQRLGEAIQQLVDPPALAKRLLQASTDLLGVVRGAVYLRQGEPPLFQLAGSFGAAPPQNDLPLDCPLLEFLQEGKVVHARPWSGLLLNPAQRHLQQLGGEIAQPLAHEGNLLAFLVLGPKGSAYRQEDLDLLAAFAQITVLALESADGHRIIEFLNQDLQAKVEKISEQQRRILALQSQLRRQKTNDDAVPTGEETESAAGAGRPEVGPGGMVGSGPVVRQLLHLVRKVSATDAVVLIRGESGTGKELLARAVHETSARAAKAFVKVHCAALSTGLLESELFGHVKGAFTGAHKDKMGRFELAHGGTLFLDEIGDISLETQTKLLRVLQEKKFERVGSSDPVTVDVRIITATHQDLENLIRQGKFREDLYYRLNVFPITVPPLRERAEDIAELSMHFMRLSAQRCHKEAAQMEDDVLVLLKAFAWPGNIRQLENVMERAVVIAEGPIITIGDLPEDLLRELENGEQRSLAAPGNGNGYHALLDRGARDRQERELFQRALAAANGNKAEPARGLGLARSTLISKLKKLGMS